MASQVKHVETPWGEIAYEEHGEGPAALFVHGVFMNRNLWRNAIDRLADVRRCIAIDLPVHGATRTAPGADLTFTAQAEMLEALCEGLGLDQVDAVGNDSGGAIVQIFAARHPERIRSLTLTNCDVHDNWPPEAFKPTMDALLQADMTTTGRAMLDDLETGRAAMGVGYENPEHIDAEKVRTFIEPLTTEENAAGLRRWMESMDNRQTVEVEPQLRELQAPTLIVWGTGDQFFDVKWAHWLRDAIPGARDVVEVEGGKLFFPDERPDEFAAAVRELWSRVEATAG